MSRLRPLDPPAAPVRRPSDRPALDEVGAAVPGPGRAAAWRQRAIRPWSPRRRTSGTARPRNSAGRVYCGYSSEPVGERLLGRRRLVAHDPGDAAGPPPRPRPGPPPRRRPGRSRRPTARRRRGGRRRAGRRPRSARTGARSPPPRGQLARPAPGRTAAARPRAGTAGRGGSTASTAAKSGSGIITMPAPPPNGASSTVRWRSVVAVRAGRGGARRAGPAPGPGRGGDAAAAPSKKRGKRVKTSTRTGGQSRSPAGGSTTTRPAAASTTKTIGTRCPLSSTRRSEAGLASTAATRPSTRPAGS